MLVFSSFNPNFNLIHHFVSLIINFDNSNLTEQIVLKLKMNMH